jgi:hypothetical protein
MTITSSMIRECVERLGAAAGEDASRRLRARILVEQRGSVPGEAPAALVDAGGLAHAVQAPCVIGRDPRGGDLTIFSDSISRRHARLMRDERDPDRWSIEDLSSTNGTFVDGRRVRPRAPAPLESRRIVSFGDVSFIFLVARPPSLAITLRPIGSPPGRAIVAYRGASVEIDGLELAFLLRLAGTPSYARTLDLADLVAPAAARAVAISVAQLARRVSRTLAALGRDDLVEASPRFGYRLSVSASVEA